MKKVLAILIALMVFVIPAALADAVETTPTEVGAGLGIGIEITPGNSCPVIEQETCAEDEVGEESGSVCYDVDTFADWEFDCGVEDCAQWVADFLMSQGWVGRSYAFEGETVNFRVTVTDANGIVQDCVKVFVTLDNGEDPIEAACVLTGFADLDSDGNAETGYFTCTYTVEPAESETVGEYWISVQASDACGGDDACVDNAAGVISLYLNPAVGLSIEAQDEFGFLYDENGDALVEGPFAGDTVYTPYFKVENAPDDIEGSASGLYIFLMLYGTDMWDYSSSGALCPISNVLDIGNVEYKASHLNVQQAWEEMPENYAGREFVFDDGLSNFGGNFLGVGDDVTMRLRLNIPSPCNGVFDDGGQIVFVGQVI